MYADAHPDRAGHHQGEPDRRGLAPPGQPEPRDQPPGRPALERADEPALCRQPVAPEFLLKVVREETPQTVAQEAQGGE